MVDLLTPRFEGSIIDRVVGTTPLVRHQWLNRDLVPVSFTGPDPDRGHPRLYSLLGVYEHAIVRRGSNEGIAQGILAGAIRRRIENAAKPILRERMPGAALWFAEELAMAVENPAAVEEFASPEAVPDLCWRIVLRPGWVDVHLCHGKVSVSADTEIFLPVAQIVCSTRDKLAAIVGGRL